jgi:hypothetical protein
MLRVQPDFGREKRVRLPAGGTATVRFELEK